MTMRAYTITDCEIVEVENDSLLYRRLRKSVEATCAHESERLVSVISTDSDSQIEVYLCETCNRTRKEEITGAQLRAEEQDDDA